jgi:gas vesicle protein
MSGMLLGVGLGALVGSVVALLFAPRTGAELRHSIGQGASNLAGKVKGRFRREEEETHLGAEGIISTPPLPPV